MAVAAKKPRTPQALAVVKKETQALVKKAELIPIILDPEAEAMAFAYLKYIAERIEKVGALFDPIVKSAYDTWKLAIAGRKEALAPFEKEDARIRELLREYRDVLDQETAEAQLAANQAVDELNEQLGEAVAVPVQIHAPVSENAKYRQDYEVKIIHFGMFLKSSVLAGKVPEATVQVNLSVLKKFIAHHQGDIALPGVSIKKIKIPVRS